MLQSLTTKGNSLPPAKREDIEKHVSSLKNQKAADIHGVAAEHIKLSSPTIIDILLHLTNSILRSGKLPDSFKIGSVSPMLKKSKPAKNPNNYRRITITSIVGKVVEKHMIQLTRPILDSTHSPLQFGFTRGSSPTYAALVLTEIMADAADRKQELQVTFMDTSKAFDVVNHKGMLNALHQQGITDSMWDLFNSMYNGIQSAVKWHGEMSNPFVEEQGIRQGGTSSADCYKAGKNSLLNQLDLMPSHRIGHIRAGAIMVADDLALIAESSLPMQVALSIAEADANRKRYRFNEPRLRP